MWWHAGRWTLPSLSMISTEACLSRVLNALARLNSFWLMKRRLDQTGFDPVP